MTDTNNEVFLTLDEAAEILKTNRRHIKRMVGAGVLRAKNIGLGDERSFFRIMKDDVLKIKKNGRSKSK